MNRFQRFVRLLTRAGEGFSAHDDSLQAAGSAYYLALSFFPLVIVLLAALGYAMQWTQPGQDAVERLLATIERQGSPDLAQQVHRALDSMGDKAKTGGLAGLGLLTLSSVATFVCIDEAFERIWASGKLDKPSWRRWLGRRVFARLKALGMLAGLGGFVLLTMIASTTWEGVRAYVGKASEVPEWIEQLVRLGLALAINFSAFTLAYRFVPRGRAPWRAAAAGALLAAVVWEAGRKLLALYLVRQAVLSAYGVIGSFLAILLWAYYAMLVVYFGAEFVHAVQESLVVPTKRAESHAGRRAEVDR